jgi:hypothetical protein
MAQRASKHETAPRPVPPHLQLYADLPLRGLLDAIMAALSDVPEPNTTMADAPHAAARRVYEAAALQAAAVSASAAMVPAPLGLMSVVPDMLLVLRLQRQMVADIAGLYGTAADLSTSVMVYCLVKHTAAQLVGDIVVRTGERWLVRRASARATSSVLRKVGLKITQRALSKAVSRFLPLAGASAMGLYARWDTMRVAATAIELFTHGVTDEKGQFQENVRETPEMLRPRPFLFHR